MKFIVFIILFKKISFWKFFKVVGDIRLNYFFCIFAFQFFLISEMFFIKVFFFNIFVIYNYIVNLRIYLINNIFGKN